MYNLRKLNGAKELNKTDLLSIKGGKLRCKSYDPPCPKGWVCISITCERPEPQPF